MRRREFIAGLGGAVAWPLAARAQQRAVPVVGYLSGVSERFNASEVFRKGLEEQGFVEAPWTGTSFRTPAKVTATISVVV
jgi:putative tryptophan/tyrosine transport system substrate-binding protein